MKTFALVDVAGIRHMEDDFERAKGMRDEALARGVRLILVKPMETIVEADWLAAVAAAIKRGEAGTKDDLGAMIMSALDDLKASVAGLRAEVQDSVGKYTALAEKLANAASAPNNEAEIKAIADEITAVTAELDKATADKPAEPAPAETPPA